jgi:hypothetical protein
MQKNHMHQWPLSTTNAKQLNLDMNDFMAQNTGKLTLWNQNQTNGTEIAQSCTDRANKAANQFNSIQTKTGISNPQALQNVHTSWTYLSNRLPYKL